MAYQKRRETKYSFFKGINSKTSKYTLDNAQVNDLVNLDFHVPNALQKRPGSTQMVATGTSGAIRSLFEFEKLNGASYLFAGSNNELNVRNGTTGFSSISSGWTNGQPEDYEAFVDKAWIANGQKMVSYDGTSLFNYGLPCFDRTSMVVNRPSNYTTGLSGTISVLGWDNGMDTGASLQAVLYALFRYERNDGYRGPYDASAANNNYFDQRFIRAISPADYQISPKYLQGTTWGNYGNDVTITFSVSFIADLGGENTDKVAMYLYLDRFSGSAGSAELLNGSGIPVITGGAINIKADFDFANFKYFSSIDAGTTQIVLAGLDNWTTFVGSAATYPSLSGIANCHFETYTPKYLEQADNRMFTAGFSSAPSVVFFSEIGEPEVIYPENVFEYRTDDGDRVTGLVNFNDELIIFKKSKFAALIGDSADNYTLKEISTEYGCLSHKAITEYGSNLLFLDERGVIRFNGASHDIISHPIEPIFRRMNVAAAQEKAVAVHLDFRNQVWFGIPVDGSSENNLTVVYDYLLDAWTTFSGFNPSTLAMAKQELGRDHMWTGDYSGMIHYFNESFYADNGATISCVLDSKFDSPDGPNVTNLYRQLFLDVNTPSGVTGQIDVEVYKDYDRTAQATFSVFQNQFQSRKDFGVGGKSVAFKMTHNSASLPLTLYGYTVRRRFLREV